ncbi:MAG: hypothetical protein OZX49_02539 [Immundisolibacter sp.]|nr:hypothetical protein [Immundisolibacter sp.]
MHLGGTVVDAKAADLAIEIGQRQVLADAARAAHLQRPVDDAIDGLGHEHLGHAGLVQGLLAAVQAPGGLPDHQPRGVHFDRRFGYQALHFLVLGEVLAERLAPVDVVHGDVQRPPGDAQPAHAVRQAPGPQAQLGVVVALADLAQHRIGTDPAAGEAHLAVAAGEGVVERRRERGDLVTGVVGVDQEQGRAVVGTRHADGKCRALRATDEPLVAVDDPLVAIAHGAREQHGRIGTGTRCRLGHGKAGAYVAARQRRVVTGPLLGRTDGMQQVHVALVRRRAVERLRSEQAAPGGLEHQRAVAPVQTQAAVFDRHARREHTGRARRLLQFGADAFQPARFGSDIGFARDDDLIDEASDLSHQRLDLGARGEIEHPRASWVCRPGILSSPRACAGISTVCVTRRQSGVGVLAHCRVLTFRRGRAASRW